MNPLPIILALLAIAWIWRYHFVGWMLIQEAKTPTKKEIARMWFHLKARRDEETAGKHLHNAILIKAREIWEREESNR